MELQDRVLRFCKSFNASPDSAVVEYLTGIFQDAEADNVDLEEIEDVVTGFFPTFSELPEDRKHDELWNLLQEGQRCQNGAEKDEDQESPKSVEICRGIESIKSLQSLSLGDSAARFPSTAESRPQPQSDARAAPPGWTPNCVDMDTGGHAVEALANLWPEQVPFCAEYAAHILHAKGLGCIEATANWILEVGPQQVKRQQELWIKEAEKEAEAREAAKRAEKEARKKTLAKFSLQPEAAAAPAKGKAKHAGYVEPWTSADQPKNGVRYRDGQLVSTRGEKFIVETLGTEWNGGSSGKVYTKGKRGKGVI